MRTLTIQVDERTEAALRRHATGPEETPEGVAARLIAHLAEEEVDPRDDGKEEPEWVRRLGPEARERHRRLRAMNERFGLRGVVLTDAMFDRANVFGADD